MNKDTLVFCLIVGSAIVGLTLAIVDPFELKLVYAQESNIEIGKDSNTEFLGLNGTGFPIYKWTNTPEKILDYYDPNGKAVYVQSKFYDDGSSINFESMGNSYKFVKDDCTLLGYDGGKITGMHTKTLSHTMKSALNGTDVWSDESVNDESCTYQMNDNQIIVTKSNFNFILQMGSSYDVVYDFFGDGSMEFTYKTTNNDFTKTDQKYGFTFVCDGIECDDIQIDNQSVGIGEIKNKTQIIDRGLKIGKNVFNLKNEQHDATWELKHPQENKLVIDFTHSKGRLAIGDTLIIDPTFSQTYSSAGHVKGDTSCTTGDEGFFYDATINISKAKSPYFDCQRAFVEWDISSIPSGATVTDTVFKFEREAPTVGRVCDVWSMEYQPSTRTATQVTVDAKDGTEFINANNFCNDSADTNQSLDLGSSADSNLQTAITASQTWWAIGITLDDEGTPSSSIITKLTRTSGTPNPTLEITYLGISAPDAVDDLTSTAISKTTVTLSFTQPNLHSGNLTNYLINSTTPHGVPQTFALNTTSLTPTITGLILGTDYSFRASPLTEGGYNTTGNILNVTTASYVPPDAPTLSVSISNTTNAKFTSISGASAGDYPVKDYGLRCEINKSTGWLNTVANSTLPASRIYDYTGLTENDLITCQWRDGSLGGWSPWSDNATHAMIITEPISGNTPLNVLNDFIVANGGIYFGIGIFTFAFLLLGVMASPKTVPIFTVIIMVFAAILHVTEIFQMPAWYWGIAVIMTITLVLKRKN